MALSVVIPTKNEEANIAACLEAFAGFEVELIVVDNSSTDRTREIAAEKGAKVLVQGPERCAQRNRGWREAKADRVMFVDADMIVPRETIAEILAADCAVALYVKEVRAGSGLRIKARNFERGFYDGTVIDGLRVLPRALLAQVGGYDENLIACEDWDLDRRILALGTPVGITRGFLIHNEAHQGFGDFLRKKAYYATSVDRYRAKWGNDAICRQQFGLGYRFFAVFFERGKWRRVLAHPVLFAIMMLERFAVGCVYLYRKRK